MAKKQVLPYVDKKSSKKSQVREMFDSISSRYDIINRVISGGLDIKWRENIVKLLEPKKPKKILDVATGTGDLAIALGETQDNEIIGIEFDDGTKILLNESVILKGKKPQSSTDNILVQFDCKFREECKKAMIDNIPLGRLATESDIATAVVYLASNASSMLTGSSLVIDGGWTAK